MKKVTVLAVTVIIVLMIVLVLLKNKAEMTQEAKIVPIDSYPVSIITVAREQLDEQLSQVGVIVANNDVNVVSEIQGRVVAVRVKEGSYVGAGSMIVKLEDELQSADYLAAQTNYEKAKKDWERYQALHKDGLISDMQLESARLACKSAEAQFIAERREYRNSIITSPISGVVTSRPVNMGTLVTKGMVVANVVDNSRFKVELNVGESNAFRLKVGDPVTIETDVYPGVKLSGRVDSISAKSDQVHTYPVKIVIPNNNKTYPLRSGMYCKVTFNLASQNALAIPRTALVDSAKEPKVFVVEGNRARLRSILIGSEVGSKLAVLQGLNEGDKVVINGQENLKDNSKIDLVK